MIQSNHGECSFNGKGIDILFELNCIFSSILEDQPELLTAVVTAWSPVIEKRIDNLDKTLMIALCELSEKLIERMEDSE